MKLITDKSFHILFFTSLLFYLTSSCSLFKHRESKLNKGGVDKGAGTVEMVPKVQYEQLLFKYEKLVKKQQIKRDGKKARKTSVDFAKDFGPKKADDIMLQTSRDKKEEKLVETVDVFGEEGIGSKHNLRRLRKNGVQKKEMEVDDNVVDSQISDLYLVEKWIENNQFDKAMRLLQKLEKSPVAQIMVMAKFYIGELLFKQKEWDLSMQIFEEIITKYAFSGVTLKTLNRLIVCCENLKLIKKKEQYYSILHDFFQST